MIEKDAWRRYLPVMVVAGLGVTVLTACGGDKTGILGGKPATVISHKYKEATATYDAGVGITMYSAAEYDLLVRQCDRKGVVGADKQGCVSDLIEVNEATYDNFKDGATIYFKHTVYGNEQP